ncbi:MAG TPA: hypothetical protein DCY35_10235 [Prolixibacteraceae bacterium]|nr:hypothetical protein [Prolixibacteraceae bacterium]
MLISVNNKSIDNAPDITAADTRGWFPWNPKYNISNGRMIPDKTTRPERWLWEDRNNYEKRVEWFHKARYGIFYHFLAYGDRTLHSKNGFTFSESDWSSDRWNQIVESIDVEKTAEQAEELGVGYVGITIGQNHRYACAPNPVIDSLWGLKPGQYNSYRDLPMDLGRALAKRGISLMIYVANSKHKLPVPDEYNEEECNELWLEALQWYSEHYRDLCKCWWVDGLQAVSPDPRGELYEYPIRLVKTLRSGNPNTLLSCYHYHLSDFIHGHCIGAGKWEKQRINCKPYFGRWDPDFNIQWHAFQYIGSYWGDTDTPLKTNELVEYATDIVRQGGVITFDVGSFKIINGKTEPCLEIPEAQMNQIRTVRDALT